MRILLIMALGAVIGSCFGLLFGFMAGSIVQNINGFDSEAEMVWRMPPMVTGQIIGAVTGALLFFFLALRDWVRGN